MTGIIIYKVVKERIFLNVFDQYIDCVYTFTIYNDTSLKMKMIYI